MVIIEGVFIVLQGLTSYARLPAINLRINPY